MKITISLLTLILLYSATVAQDYEPTILILSPHVSDVDRKLQKELKGINAQLEESAQQSASAADERSDLATLPENIRLMTSSEQAFLEDRSFFTLTSYISQQYLTYRFYERFPNLLILLSKSTRAGNKSELKILADSAKTQYVLNFPSISLFRSGNMSNAKVRVQLFDSATGEYLLDNEFSGDAGNPGFEFACEAGSLQCTINNALSQALPEVIRLIAENSPTLQRERRLAQDRYEELMSNHFTKSGNLDLVKQVVRHDEEINAENIYHVLYDGSNSKFLAFSVEQVTAQDLKTLSEKGKDRNVSIISSKSITDGELLSSMPKTYAFIIRGVKFEDEWYYEKANVTYFEAESVDDGRRKYFNNLQSWDFFMENSTMVSPNFWERGFFEKVPDLKQHPDWDKYGDDMWKSEEANNRPYVGMYQIVANVKRREKQAENALFEKHVKENIFTPAYEALKKKDPHTWKEYSDHSLIYASSRDVIINPVLVTDRKGVKTAHYFVAFSGINEIYEWTYFPVQDTKGNSALFGSTVVDQLESITDWNFSYDALDDEEFWKKYVLLKENGQFKHLRRVGP